MPNPVSENRNRDFVTVVVVWLLLAIALIFVGCRNISVPGLYYDEAQCAALAKDFLSGHPHPHMPGSQVVTICGRPFPTYAQIYIGAVKSWLLLPSFAVFGASQSVLRFTALGLGVAALLLFMLWTWRWLGKDTALLGGALLAFDPTFFFVSVLDWGLVLPSFLCRFACFYFALRWWQTRNEKTACRGLCLPFFAGFFAGLGFFNKIDFAVLLAGVFLALVCCNARGFWRYLVPQRPAIRNHPLSALAWPFAFACLGFLLTAGPMLTHMPTILRGDKTGGLPGEMTEKFDAMFAMYDGSYFYHLMDAGGLFDKMYQAPAPVFAPIGIALLLAAVYLFFRFVREKSFRASHGTTAGFLLLSILFITIGIFLLPGAVRIHHMVLVYPFPQLVVAVAVTRALQRRWIPILCVLLVAPQLFVIYKTETLIRQTGGRGWWSDALNVFAGKMRARSDLTIVSLDWGFNEQMALLTDGPRLVEPVWGISPWNPAATNCIYLTHSPEYRLLDFGPAYLQAAHDAGFNAVDVTPWKDREGNIAFFSLYLRKETPPPTH